MFIGEFGNRLGTMGAMPNDSEAKAFFKLALIPATIAGFFGVASAGFLAAQQSTDSKIYGLNELLNTRIFTDYDLNATNASGRLGQSEYKAFDGLLKSGTKTGALSSGFLWTAAALAALAFVFWLMGYNKTTEMPCDKTCFMVVVKMVLVLAFIVFMVFACQKLGPMLFTKVVGK